MTRSQLKVVVTGDVADWHIPSFEVDRIPEPFRRIIRECDLFVPNLEGPIGSSGEHAPARLSSSRPLELLLRLVLRLIGKRPVVVTSSPRVLPLLELNGRTCVTLANNHANDLGAEGIDATVALLRQRNILWLGAGRTAREANAARVVEVSGKVVVLLNYNYIGLRRWGFFANIFGATAKRSGAAYLPPDSIRREIERLKREWPGAFFLLIVHAGRARAGSLEEAGVDAEAFERLGADCVVFHHSHRFFGTRNGRSFFLGDFVFAHPGALPEERPGGFLELTIDTATNAFRYRTHGYRFDNGYPITSEPAGEHPSPQEVE